MTYKSGEPGLVKNGKHQDLLKRKSTKSFSVFGFRLVLTDPMLPLSRYSPVTDFASQLRTFFLFTDFRFSIMNLRYITQLSVSKLLSLLFYTAFAHSYPLFYSEYIRHFLLFSRSLSKSFKMQYVTLKQVAKLLRRIFLQEHLKVF